MVNTAVLKRLLIILFLLSCHSLHAHREEREYVVVNPNGEEVAAMPVEIAIQGWERSARVFSAGDEIPSQIDDINSDGTLDRLAFVLDMKAGEKRLVSVRFSDTHDPAEYTPRAAASMSVGGVPAGAATVGGDSLYLVSGPGFGTGFVKYRVRPDGGCVLEFCGRPVPSMESEGGEFVPLGTGILCHADSAGSRPLMAGAAEYTLRVVASGPARAIVEVAAGREDINVALRTRYTIWAGHRDVAVDNILSGEGVEDLRPAVRLERIPAGEYRSEIYDPPYYIEGEAEGVPLERGRYMAVWGGKVEYGVAVYVHRDYLAEEMPGAYLLRPDSRGWISFRMTAASSREELGYRDSWEFNNHVERWLGTKPAEVVRYRKHMKKWYYAQ